jgi:hypothetical protein
MRGVGVIVEPAVKGRTGPVAAIGQAAPSPAALSRPRNFKALVCQQLRCSPQDYEERLFSYCLHLHTRPIARLLSRIDPDFFEEDIGLICDLATAGSHAEVRMELDRFYGRNLRDRNWLRKTFSLRLSGKRVLSLSRRLFHGRVRAPRG